MLAAAGAATMQGKFALICKTRTQHADEMVKRPFGIIPIIAAILPREQNMPGMMIVVVPLGAVAALRRIGLRVEQMRAIAVIFEHQMDCAAGRRCQGSCRFAQIMQD